MNNKRRKQIINLIINLNNELEELNNILSDEEYYFDNIPENLSTSIRADESEEAIDILNEAVDKLNETIENLEEI